MRPPISPGWPPAWDVLALYPKSCLMVRGLESRARLLTPSQPGSLSNDWRRSSAGVTVTRQQKASSGRNHLGIAKPPSLVVRAGGAPRRPSAAHPGLRQSIAAAGAGAAGIRARIEPSQTARFFVV